MSRSKVEALLAHPLFSGLDAGVLWLLAKDAAEREYAIGSCLLAEGDGPAEFFILTTGSVRVFYRAPDSREVLVKLFGSPAVFGEMECLAGLNYLESVEALEKSKALVLSSSSLRVGLDQSPLLTRRLLNDLAVRLCIAAQHERRLAFEGVEVRLAQVFLSHLDVHGLPVDGGVKIRVALSQEVLAQAVAATRRSVFAVLKAWSAVGWVNKVGRHWVVRNRAELEKLSANTPLRLSHLSFRSK